MPSPSRPKNNSLRDLDGDGDVDLADDPTHDLDRDGRIDAADRESEDLDRDNDIDARDRELKSEQLEEAAQEQKESVGAALGKTKDADGKWQKANAPVLPQQGPKLG